MPPAARQAQSIWLPTTQQGSFHPLCLPQLFLEQNEDEAEKMEAKEEKQREIEKSQIKVRRLRGARGGRAVAATEEGGSACGRQRQLPVQVSSKLLLWLLQLRCSATGCACR